ncbi:TonB-dependent receptor [Pseudomonas sp. R3.Fl]|uniref:TonB-dependent receptor n=1 Tax=Pseudomonas sp. R3.Fl TaxID=2928708 RepID=UPI00201DF8C2|nr:TonB-dependent receptor [Pseudomonas sp. R3.Fl]
MVLKSYRAVLLAPALSGLFTLSPVAQAEDNKELESLTVTATRSSAAAEDSPRTLTVISGEQVRERVGSGGIQSLLAEIPGIEFARSGGLGGQLVVRGFNSNSGRSILAIDGDRYRGRSTLEFNMIDPDSIERIEIIRGPASALYGSDAMNGVVNIVTRRAKVDPSQSFELTPKLRALEWNSGNSMFGGRAEMVGGGNGFDVLLGVNQRSASDYSTPIGDASNSGYSSLGGDFAIGYSPDSDSRWELSGRYQRVVSKRAGGLGAAPGEPFMDVREDPITERYLRLGYQNYNVGAWADSLDSSLYVRDFETDIYQRNSTAATVDAFAHIKVYTPTVWGGHLTAMKQLGEHNLSYGGDFFNERFDGRENNARRYNRSTGALLSDSGWNQMERDSEQTNLGLFVNDDWRFDERWSFTGALRGDVVDVDIGDTFAGEAASLANAYRGNTDQRHYAVTGSLGAVYRLTPAWHLVGNLSRGFRAPSGNELTISSTAGTQPTLPSPDLDPETNVTAEAGVRWYGERSQLNLTAYQSKYKDLISLVRLDSTLYQRQNVAKATIRGLELDGRTQLAERWSLGYAATLTRGRDDKTDQDLPYIAPLTGNLKLRYDTGHWYGEGVVRAYQGKHHIDEKQERETSSYAMVDLYAGIDLDRVLGNGWQDWKLMGGVENLFDRVGRNPTVAENLAYPNDLVGNPLVEPGRALVVKLSVDY